MKICGKIWDSQTDHTSHYNRAQALHMLDN